MCVSHTHAKADVLSAAVDNCWWIGAHRTTWVELNDEGRVCIGCRHVLQEVLNLLVYEQQPFFSRTDPVVAATVLGVTGMLLDLMVNVDFLSLELFLDLGCPATSSWCTTSFLHSLSGTSEGQVTSGFSLKTGFCMGMHHAGYERHSRACVWFNGIWITLVHSAFMVYPSELSKFVQHSSPRHAFLQVTQVGSRVDMVPQWIYWFRC